MEYRDRPAGSVSKLDTVGDGIKVIAMIGTLFKDYRPLKFFSLIALIFAAIGLALGIPIIVEYFHTGLVPRFPTAMLAACFMFLCGLSGNGLHPRLGRQGRKETMGASGIQNAQFNR